ncbi:RagB/SusD family nutrient uptake outer membrane protein [Pedobacter nyackensis]|uniref:RagB/SusD family nutrient uptake outer membrane protein n=1 Tax=Pedobacter nyackensis TaxID=475255 RepID=UPI00292F4989|nr:RagB/SusD family nutrient uptake outer membrane protein [Pedobacter nyackensis]
MKKNISILFAACSILMLGSCKKWLSISPKIEMSTDKVFSSEQTVKDALSGVYVLMKDQSVYGQDLSYRYIDNMASLWEVTSASMDESFNLHQYNKVTPQVDNIYGKLYNAIANLNNIIENIELNKSVFKSKDLYDIIKGESLALRAFLHFDLMRLYGPVPSKAESGGPKLAYVENISKEINVPISFEEYKTRILRDLHEAQLLLKNDPLLFYSAEALRSPSEFAKIANMNEFFANRTSRMNYYAAKSIEARVNLWYGDKPQAYEAAMEVINAKNADGTRKFDINKTRNALIGKTDNLLVCEQIFGLFDYNLPNKYTLSFANGQLFNGKNSDKIVKTMFGNTGTDIRELYLWEKRDYIGGVSKFITNKYNSSAMNRQIPIIRLSELYFIAIESSASKSTVQPLWDEYRATRYIAPKTLPVGEALLRSEILIEFRKEFYAEGQLFYLYKRYNSPKSEILFASALLSPNYVLPLPKTELGN